MSVQYAGGTNVNTTFTCTVGTRREIVDGLVAALTTAGWSMVSGGGTGTVVMRSATTPTASNVIDVRIHDPGSGNCAQIRMQNAADAWPSAPPVRQLPDRAARFCAAR